MSLFKSIDLFLIMVVGEASENQCISERVIKKAFLVTEESFLSLVEERWHGRPQIASAGTCCLVGIICNGMIYVANVGDSRAVLGREERATHEVRAIQLSAEHNASIQSVREELQAMHPYDSQIVVLKHKVWRVKGLIQVRFFTILAAPKYSEICKLLFVLIT